MSGARRDTIRLAAVTVPPTRLRQADPAWVEALAAMMAADGLLQPIGVAEAEPGYTLQFGLHRLAAAQVLGWETIEAVVWPRGITAEEVAALRTLEISENIIRYELTALDRAAHLAEWKRLYQELHPETRRGGDRRGKDQSAKIAVWPFSAQAAEKTGLSARAIETAVSIHTGLAPAIRARLHGTWLADHQAGLLHLAQQDADTQAAICDLLFATPPAAASVADALVLAEGRRLPSRADRLIRAVTGSLSRMTPVARTAVWNAHEAELRDWAREKGWLPADGGETA